MLTEEEMLWNKTYLYLVVHSLHVLEVSRYQSAPAESLVESVLADKTWICSSLTIWKCVFVKITERHKVS